MASHIEMQRLAGDPAAVRTLAQHLLGQPDANWTDWEVDFLDNMASRAGSDPLTMRQREVLVELRDNARSHRQIEGLSVAGLVHQCWLARMDLEEDDEAFIVALKSANTAVLKRRPLLRLLHCARQLGLIDGFVAVA